MTTITAFSTLINQDLACVSAREAITHILNYPRLRQLKRYTQWEFTFGNLTLPEAESAVTTIFTKTFFLINPNKENYALRLPANLPKSSGPQIAISVRPKSPVNWSAMCTKIKSKTSIEVSSIASSTVWVMDLNPGELSEEALREELTERVILAGSVKQGILVNPVSEQFEWLETRATGTYAVA